MERVTRAEAARQMNVNKSTISRWVEKHPALLNEDGLVSVTDLEEHRATMVNPALQTKTVLKTTSRKAKPNAIVHSVNDHRARREEARATEAELDLAERLKLTLRRSDVEAAVAEAGDLLRQKAGQLVRDRAELMAKIDDVRAMERALDDLMRELLASAAGALAKSVAVEEDVSAA
jgi:hypothetical protein